MYLLVDPVNSPAAFVVFDSDRSVVSLTRTDLSGQEFERFLDAAEGACRNSGTALSALDGIVCVRGPAGFTGIRVVSLTLSTLALANGTPLFELDAFELRALAGSKFPVVFRANRDEYAFSPAPGSEFSIVRKTDLAPGEYSGIGLESDFEGRGVRIESSVDYGRAVARIDLSRPVGKIEPLYLKKPHITQSA